MTFSRYLAHRCIFLLAIVSTICFVEIPALAKPTTAETTVFFTQTPGYVDWGRFIWIPANTTVNSIVIDITFSEAPDPAPKKADFMLGDKTVEERYADKLGSQGITIEKIENSPKHYRLRIYGKTGEEISALPLHTNLVYKGAHKVTLVKNKSESFIDLSEKYIGSIHRSVQTNKRTVTIDISFFEPPTPEPTKGDWTINNRQALPANTRILKIDSKNYQIKFLDTTEVPLTLEFRNYRGFNLKDNQEGYLINEKIVVDFRSFSTLRPLAFQTTLYENDFYSFVAIDISFNVPPYPTPTEADFLFDGKPIPQHLIDDYEAYVEIGFTDRSFVVTLGDTTVVPKTLQFRDFPPVSLIKNGVIANTTDDETLISVLAESRESETLLGNYIPDQVHITLAYNRPTQNEPKLTDFTINGGQPLSTWPSSSVLIIDGGYGDMRIEWIIVFMDTTRIPRTFEAPGFHPVHLVRDVDLLFVPLTYVVPTEYGSPVGAGTILTKQSGAQIQPGVYGIPAKDKIVINEIANLSGASDWIELLNISDTGLSLDKTALSIVTEYNDETEIIRFPDVSIPAGGILLLVNMDPANTDLATGHNVKVNTPDHPPDADENISYLIVKGETNYGFTSPGIDLPDHNDWMLILRSGTPWDVKDGNDIYNTGYQIEDVAGPASITLEIDENEINQPKEKNKDGTEGGDLWSTTVFPLNSREDTGDMLLRFDRTLNEGTVHARDVDKHGFEVHSFNPAPFTGIGYDNDITDDGGHLGTPGYPNVVVSSVSDLKTGQFIVSELMLTTDDGTYAQWIELHNTSKSEAINLEDPDGDGDLTAWKMTIENHNSGSWKRIRRNLHVEVDLSEWFQYIPPKQKVLIAAFADRNSGASDFPSTRVATLWETHRRSFSMIKRGNLFLNASGGFTIKITDSQGNVSDSVGNLDGTAADPDADIGNDDPVGFDWPTELTEDGHRTSLIRLKNTDGSARTGMPTRDSSGAATDKKGSVLSLGGDESSDTESFAWKHAADINLDDLAKMTWFGNENDISTPLNLENTMMPVLLSYFRPILENGEVLIQWTTEAELDNAGFHILRSETRDGHFKRINTQLIQGAGSTAERQTYEWIDTTAKPGVVYYYQIEDVSFSGERYRLATTKLKGFVSAKNKLTTQWGTLKEQD